MPLGRTKTCRSGGIGRRTRSKPVCRQRRGGSTPPCGTRFTTDCLIFGHVACIGYGEVAERPKALGC